MALERELKYSVSDGFVPSREELAAALEGSPFRAGATETLAVVDRYLDDDAGSLRRARLALRTRAVGGATRATLKSGAASAGALHERDEVELPMPGAELPEPIRARVGAVTELARLRARVELRTARTVVTVVAGGREVAYLSFDAVEARRPGGARGAHFHEVEVEAVGGTARATLEAIAARVDALVALTPNSSTKLERAEALLQPFDD